ncbi:MAG: hypothetical protein ABIN01_18445 [Ferruginibacter sp.]
MNKNLSQWENIFKLKFKQDKVTFDELYEILIVMKNDGLDSESAYKLLTNLRNNLGDLNNQYDDLLLELMDIVTGYCSARLKIW